MLNRYPVELPDNHPYDGERYWAADEREGETGANKLAARLLASTSVRCARCNRVWYGTGWLCDDCADLVDEDEGYDDSLDDLGRWD